LKKVFISHSSQDKPIERRIGEFLKQNSVGAWIDEGEIQPGDSLVEKIGSGIETSDYLLAIISQYSATSSWVQKEISVSLNLEIKDKHIEVIPLKLDNTPVPTMDSVLSTVSDGISSV
jgi:hypothetical protein